MKINNKIIKNQDSILLNQKGIALVMVLILSLIALAMVSALIYFVTQGAKISGYYRQYGSARDAGIGGSEIMEALIEKRGELEIPGITDPVALADCISFPNRCDCGDPDVIGDNKMFDGINLLDLTGKYICLCAKLCDPTVNWVAAGCDDSFAGNILTNPDFQCSFPGTASNFLVSAKIIDSVIGSSDISGEKLGGTGVVSSNSGLIPSPPAPYMFRFEVDSMDENTAKAIIGGGSPTKRLERSRYSVLFAY